ncbi:beta-propeller fold lactonase family protein [Streptomyces sp. NBC_01190]|uniref:beta-propeller fold lactonase family protein n=1 Tax=Streptomyces sp. NBC_01190 TaxID=2903767 RepID=UPI00386FAE3E|nr:beta-propeller fold lactonase family protein [Streptomyces sp. NBC_01190]
MLSVAALGAALTATGLAGPVAHQARADTPKGFAYVVNNQSDSVTTISVSTGGTATIKVGTGPTAVAIAPNGEEAYVANGRSDSVSVLDTGDKRQVATIPVGSRPSGVAFGADGTRAYVANAGANTVSVIDTAQRRVVATIGVGSGPSAMAVTPDGTRLYVANNSANTVSVIDTSSNTKLTDDSVGKRPIALAVLPDGSKVLVADNGSNNVSVLDVGTDKVTQTVAAGSGPSGIAVTPDGTRAYVSNVDSNDVTVLKSDVQQVYSIDRGATIGVGSHPLGVAVSPDGEKVYVPDNGGKKTSVIKTDDNSVSTSDVDSGPAAVATGVPQELSAVVTMGDSFISGVAGRWQGNGQRSSAYTDVHGTDRSVYNCLTSGVSSVCSSDPRLVYGTSYKDAAGCMRSYSAEAQSADVPVYRKINIACSGAETENIIDQPLKGEPAQSVQLAALAAHYKVKMVVLDIGGNDIGFRGVIRACVEAFLYGSAPCQSTQEQVLMDGVNRAKTGIAAAIAKVRSVMGAAGYANGDYRLVIQSYPSPLPDGDDLRYPATYNGRALNGGCPVFDSDATWVRGDVVPLIGNVVGYAAGQSGAEYLDVTDLFDGHEVCAKGAEQAASENYRLKPQLGNNAEWARFLDAAGPLKQGDQDESVHPNFYGQRALASCLTAVWGYDGSLPDHVCHNVSGKGAEHVTLSNKRY